MNNIKKYLNKAVIFGGVILSLSACKIDVVPTDRYTEEVIWSEPQSVDLYVNGMYNEFKTFQFGQFPIGYSNATDALSDILKYTSTVSGNGTVNILASDASRVSAASPHLSYWAPGYERIRRLNEFMDGLDKYSSFDEDEKNVFKAEARFIRGYVYFWLARIHGSVVIMDEMADYAVKDNPRASEDEVWNFVAADFAFAAEHLPKNWVAAKKGKATKGAAYGFLARTWLYAASIAQYDRNQFNTDPLTGVPNAKAKEYYQNAVNASQKVIELGSEGLYSLASDFAGIFTNKSSTESVFQIDFVAPQITHAYDMGFVPPGDDKANALVYGVPTAELVDEFEMANGGKFDWNNSGMSANPYLNREKRFYGTILYNGAQWKGRTLNTTPNDATEGFTAYGASSEPKRTVTGYYVRKMLDETNRNLLLNRSSQSWIEMRYAEVILINAEAKLGAGDFEGARQALNTLRIVREVGSTPAANTSELFEAIKHERMVELAFEGHRYWDLRRWRIAHLELNDTRVTGHRITPSGNGLNYEVVTADNADRSFTPALYYIPIPELEVQRNTGLEQIKGW